MPAGPPAQLLSLEAAPALPAKLRHAHPLSHYAAVYGYAGDRTIKSFVSRGRHSQPPDLPPLDDPAAMPAWYRRHFRRIVPNGILRAARDFASKKPIAPEPAPAPVEKTTLPAVTVPVGPPSSSLVFDFPAQVAELRRAAHAVACEIAAIAAETCPVNLTDPQDIERWHSTRDARRIAAQRSQTHSMAELRKQEAALLDWQQRHGHLVLLADARADVTRIISAIHRHHTRLHHSLRPELARLGLTDAQIHDLATLLDQAERAAYRILKETHFADPALIEQLAVSSEEKAA